MAHPIVNMHVGWQVSQIQFARRRGFIVYAIHSYPEKTLENIQLTLPKMYFTDTKTPLHGTVNILCNFILRPSISFSIPADYFRDLTVLWTNNNKTQLWRYIMQTNRWFSNGQFDLFLFMLENRMHDNISQIMPYKCFPGDILIFTDSNQLIISRQDLWLAHPHFLFRLRNKI